MWFEKSTRTRSDIRNFVHKLKNEGLLPYALFSEQATMAFGFDYLDDIEGNLEDMHYNEYGSMTHQFIIEKITEYKEYINTYITDKKPKGRQEMALLVLREALGDSLSAANWYINRYISLYEK